MPSATEYCTPQAFFLFYFRKFFKMLVHVACNHFCNLFFHIHELLLQIVESLILLVHGHKLIIGTILFQIGTVGIIYILCLINKLGKILRPGRRNLCAGQVQTVYPTASTVQRGTQTESKRERKANRVQEPNGIM